MRNVKVVINKTKEKGTIQALSKPIVDDCNYCVVLDGDTISSHKLKTVWKQGKELTPQKQTNEV